MRRFNLQNRIRRCRLSICARESTCEEAVGGQLEQVPSLYVCDVTFAPGISARQRAYVLGKDDLFCKMCGASPGDIDELTGNRAEFHIGLIADKNYGGKKELSNFQTLCSSCEEGVRELRPTKPPAIWLLSQIRRAGQDEQRAVLDWLLKKFKE